MPFLEILSSTPALLGILFILLGAALEVLLLLLWVRTHP